jgi:hypothetical protein
MATLTTLPTDMLNLITDDLSVHALENLSSVSREMRARLHPRIQWQTGNASDILGADWQFVVVDARRYIFSKWFEESAPSDSPLIATLISTRGGSRCIWLPSLLRPAYPDDIAPKRRIPSIFYNTDAVNALRAAGLATVKPRARPKHEGWWQPTGGLRWLKDTLRTPRCWNALSEAAPARRGILDLLDFMRPFMREAASGLEYILRALANLSDLDKTRGHYVGSIGCLLSMFLGATSSALPALPGPLLELLPAFTSLALMQEPLSWKHVKEIVLRLLDTVLTDDTRRALWERMARAVQAYVVTDVAPTSLPRYHLCRPLDVETDDALLNAFPNMRIIDIVCERRTFPMWMGPRDPSVYTATFDARDREFAVRIEQGYLETRGEENLPYTHLNGMRSKGRSCVAVAAPRRLRPYLDRYYAPCKLPPAEYEPASIYVMPPQQYARTWFCTARREVETSAFSFWPSTRYVPRYLDGEGPDGYATLWDEDLGANYERRLRTNTLRLGLNTDLHPMLHLLRSSRYRIVATPAQYDAGKCERGWRNFAARTLRVIADPESRLHLYARLLFRSYKARTRLEIELRWSRASEPTFVETLPGGLGLLIGTPATGTLTYVCARPELFDELVESAGLTRFAAMCADALDPSTAPPSTTDDNNNASAGDVFESASKRRKLFVADEEEEDSSFCDEDIEFANSPVVAGADGQVAIE